MTNMEFPMRRIFHLTDMHIADPSSREEHLRTMFYAEYLEGICQCIKKVDNSSIPIDAIVLSGDIVDRGVVSNFDHAKHVVKTLAKQLNVNEESVFLCNGNHDIVRDLELSGDILEARSKFYDFSRLFSRREGSEKISDRAEFIGSNTAARIHFLSLDSTIGAAGNDCAGSLDVDERDKVANFLRAKRDSNIISEKHVLIVASHHPPISITEVSPVVDEGDPDWHKKHIWHDASALATRIRRALPNVPIIWFSGDVHQPGWDVKNNICFVTTGCFGRKIGGRHSNIPCQARLIDLPHDLSLTSKLFLYRHKTHNTISDQGDWEIEESPADRTNKFTFQAEILHAESLPANPLSNKITNLPESALGVLTLSDDLEISILRAVQNSNLYQLGRFSTNANITTLAWVPIAPLLNYGSIFASALRSMMDRISIIIKDNPSKSIVLIGLDCWGSIFASQISVVTGVKNICIAGRTASRLSSRPEGLTSGALSELRDTDICVVFTDVIGTGESLLRVKNAILNSVDAERIPSQFYAFSLICDRLNPRRNLSNEFVSVFTCCGNLRIPMIDDNLLPPHSILQPLVSLV